VRLEDAVLYELHLGTFTPEGTLAAATGRLGALAELGVNAVELLPIAAFPGRWNWGYDGVYPFALHAGYGTYAELAAFIEAAHARGIAVLLDVVYNHFGPEGNYSAQFGPYTKSAETPWGAAINFNREFNYGVREFFLENTRYWLQDIGFDGLRMDAVSMIFDDMPVHILREMTDLARAIAAAEGRELMIIAEHLRNNRYVTAESGYAFDSQWNDDLTHAVFAHLTGERQMHYANFGPFEDVVTAFERGYVLDGTRFDHYRKFLLGSDGRPTRATEHLVYIQNHDQVGNRPFGDRMVETHGRQRALLALTAMFASPFVPMLFMGDEYGETTPFLFFEDFSDADVIEGVRKGRRADFDFGSAEPPDPHAQKTFEACKLRWERRESPAGAAMLAYVRALIALKRKGLLGPRDRNLVRVAADRENQVIRLETDQTLTVMNFSPLAQPPGELTGWRLALTWAPLDAAGRLTAYGAAVFARPESSITDLVPEAVIHQP
jgi:maltooligosyltrehalose trehalohydrolase